MRIHDSPTLNSADGGQGSQTKTRVSVIARFQGQEKVDELEVGDQRDQHGGERERRHYVVVRQNDLG